VSLHYLFTYGILKRPDAIPAEVVGEIRDVGPYPAARFDRDGVVVGVIRQVMEEDLEEMDWIEGVPHLYTRIILDPEKVSHTGYLTPGLPIWAYQFVDLDYFERLPIVEGGKWERYR